MVPSEQTFASNSSDYAWFSTCDDTSSLYLYIIPNLDTIDFSSKFKFLVSDEWHKMIPKETNFTTKQESSTGESAKIPKPSSSTTVSSSRLKDPRIVRVSRAFGGKDRHSKVCTVRGLRDRRVRLSVPTAIQLYDLQDRLGLNQPSKVVDWLLIAAKHEIDELPPLQFPQGSFAQHVQPMLTQSDKQGLKISTSSIINWNDDPLKNSVPNIFLGKSNDRDESWARSEEERQFNLQDQDAYVSANNLLFRENCTIPSSSFVRWDPGNLTLSHPPRSHGLIAPQEDWQNFSLVPLPSTLSVPSQVLVYQPGNLTVQSYFTSQIAATSTDFSDKDLNFQSSQLSNSSPVDSTTQPVRQIQFNMTANLLPSQDNDESKQN